MIGFSYKQGPTPDTYNCKYMKTPLDNSVFDVPFYIECTDDPSKLHKFCEMKYLGLVDNPHYKKIGDLLREMVKKFDGCLVVCPEDSAVLITRTKPIKLGCANGACHVLRDVLVQFGDRKSSDCASFWKIDANKIPSGAWIYNHDYDQNICALYKQLKDLEP